MHAYLIIGTGQNDSKINSIATHLNARKFSFPINKIDDVRVLNSFTALKTTEITAVVVKNIDEATNEALNAFLKNLEEPQENLYYILTAKNENTLLPTIVSRCQIIRMQPDKNNEEVNVKINAFYKMNKAEKLAFFDQIKIRADALIFLENFITVSHDLLHKTGAQERQLAKDIETAAAAYQRIKANGNVNLQLTNMVCGLV